MITIPETTSLLAYAGQLFTDLWIWIAVIIGLPLGFFVIQLMIDFFKQGFEEHKKRKALYEKADKIMAETKRLLKE
jgi:hypothetical protein